MSFSIPKIVYGDMDTEVRFDFPPELDDGEQLEAAENVSTSISGVRQVSISNIEIKRAPTFTFVSDAKKAELYAFYSTFGLFGKAFKYFEDQDGADFVYYECDKFEFKPKRTTGKRNYPWAIPFKFRRVLGFTEGDNEVINILNNQASPVDLVSVVFDKAEFSSAIITGELRRKTDSGEVLSTLTLIAQYRSVTDDWIISAGPDVSELPIGVVFSITSAGQVKYTSDNLAGANYVGVYKIKQSKFTT